MDDLVKCSKCESANPSNKLFCGDCGTSLDPVMGSVKSYLDSILVERLESVLKERFRDQRVIEIDVAANAAEKVMGWTKLLGSALAFFVAVTLGLVGFLGYHSLSDFRNHINESTKTAERAIDQAVENGNKDLEKSKRQLDDNKVAEKKIAGQLKGNLEKAQSDGTVAGNIEAQLKTLQRRVSEQQTKLQTDSSRIDNQQKSLGVVAATLQDTTVRSEFEQLRKAVSSGDQASIKQARETLVAILEAAGTSFDSGASASSLLDIFRKEMTSAASDQRKLSVLSAAVFRATRPFF